MNDKTSATEQLQVLRQKLEAAVSSRSDLEEDFKTQSSLLVTFIGKLSLLCKGMDIELDNRLGNLRALLSKSAPISDIEQQVTNISKIIQRLSVKNEQNIRLMHTQFMEAGKVLQKINGLPDDLRRNLRALLKDSEDSKDSVVEYVPLLSQLITFYDIALHAKNGSTQVGLLNNNVSSIPSDQVNDAVVQEVLSKFIKLLNGLVLSKEHNEKISSIKSALNKDMPNEKLLYSFLETFHVIVEDLSEERKTSESFLSTLNNTLSTVQTAVKSTLSGSRKSNTKHSKLNQQLQQHISEMSGVVISATSLTDIKTDINDKLSLIANALEEKSTLESEQQLQLEQQLKTMNMKVRQLEKQSAAFEKRLVEQQSRSMLDALTKLNNRAAFDDYFSKQMVRFHNHPFDLAIVVLDLDNFKRINDTYGHTAGDKTLQVIANTLSKYIEKEVFISRYGGEEFVLIYPDIKKQTLLDNLNMLREHISKLPFKFKNNKVTITMSMGATHVQQADNIHIAFERADSGLYKAKEKGKNTVVYL